MRQLLFTFLLLALSIYTVEAKGIKFHNDILDEALAMAKAEGKYVFIDTYATSRAPCTKDRVARLSVRVRHGAPWTG